MVYILYNGEQRGLLFAKFLFLYTNAAKSSLSTVLFFFPFLFLSSGENVPRKIRPYWHRGATGRKMREMPLSCPPVSHTWLPPTELAGSPFNKDMEMLLQSLASSNEDGAKKHWEMDLRKNAWQMAWSAQRMVTKCRSPGKVLSRVPAI